jgi:hypothetical protein
LIKYKKNVGFSIKILRRTSNSNWFFYNQSYKLLLAPMLVSK